jgi:hypothetical protein
VVKKGGFTIKFFPRYGSISLAAFILCDSFQKQRNSLQRDACRQGIAHENGALNHPIFVEQAKVPPRQ